MGALGAAFLQRFRATLTVLGIGIGTASIVVLASLLHGGERALLMAEQETADDDIVEVHREEPPPRLRERTRRPLSRADAAAIATSTASTASTSNTTSTTGVMVAAESSLDVWARVSGRRKRVALVSASGATMSLYRLSIATGRGLDAQDAANGGRVCVIGDEVYRELAQGAPLGPLRLEIDGRLFRVVGVLAKKLVLDATDGTSLWNRKVLIPERTYDALYAPSHAVDRIYVREPGLTPSARASLRAAVRALLLRRHLGIADFELAKDRSGGTEELVLTAIQALLLGTGLLALFAAGINVMNVMFVTVSERAREVGLRRALGATRRDILLQFLLEAAAMSSAGGVLGVVVGAATAIAIALLARSSLGFWELAIPPWSVVAGLFMALVTGLTFGALPAWRGSRVPPVDALRSE